jgi:putative NADPH-quinone reductase
MKTLVILAHPTLASSVANSTVIEQFKASGQDITIRHLDALYSDYNINVEAEQAALMAADTIVLQFPFYWYSAPASLKNWIDKVFSFNFAYGPSGDKLKGKNLIISTTVGGPKEAYNPLGYNHFQVRDLLLPFEQTAYLSGLNYHEPIFTHSCVYIPGVYNVKEEVEERARNHANRVIKALEQLTQ